MFIEDVTGGRVSDDAATVDEVKLPADTLMPEGIAQ